HPPLHPFPTRRSSDLYETSAGTLNWAWYLLAAHPDVRQHVATEGRALAGNPDDIDENSAAAMTYTQAVLDETLRLYPPVWLFTRSEEHTSELQSRENL